MYYFRSMSENLSGSPWQRSEVIYFGYFNILKGSDIDSNTMYLREGYMKVKLGRKCVGKGERIYFENSITPSTSI